MKHGKNNGPTALRRLWDLIRGKREPVVCANPDCGHEWDEHIEPDACFAFRNGVPCGCDGFVR